ncbi:hypothetical protein SAMN05216310_10478 [Nitrosomonas europaea]|nr:hypothetical protein SAMN05216310_10478 [Nitrosomonas europaea]SJZ33949.1 hypothetical protein SAMN02745113_00534 [Nitrosomonas europaea]
MGNYYQGKCYSTTLDLHQEIAGNCPTVSPDGAYTIRCVPSTDKIVITRTNTGLIPVPVSTDYIPQQIACDPNAQMHDAIDAAWLIAGAWVVAYMAKKVAEVIRS